MRRSVNVAAAWAIVVVLAAVGAHGGQSAATCSGSPLGVGCRCSPKIASNLCQPGLRCNVVTSPPLVIGSGDCLPPCKPRAARKALGCPCKGRGQGNCKAGLFCHAPRDPAPYARSICCDAESMLSIYGCPCGGFTMSPQTCYPGFKCNLTVSLPDLPGTCILS